ncbi:hypothetical protein Tco_1355817 [Tanacetum coccineum]
MTTLAEHLIVAGAENRSPMLEKSIGPLVYPTVKENRQTRPKKYSKLTEAQQLQDDYDVQATNIFTVFHPIFSQLINDMHTIGMTMQQVQVNTKFLNALPPESGAELVGGLVGAEPPLINPLYSLVTYCRIPITLSLHITNHESIKKRDGMISRERKERDRELRENIEK